MEIRRERIGLFLNLAQEHRQQETRRANTQRENEIARLRAWLALGQMTKAYRRLNTLERHMVVFNIEIVRPSTEIDRRLLRSIIGIGRDYRDLRYDFEQYLSEPKEIDFMSAWSIFPEMDKLTEQYRAELEKSGLLVKDDNG